MGEGAEAQPEKRLFLILYSLTSVIERLDVAKVLFMQDTDHVAGNRNPGYGIL